MTVDEVLYMLTAFRNAGQVEYNAYSALFDAVSALKDGDNKEDTT